MELIVYTSTGTAIVDGELGTSSFVSLRLDGAAWDLRTQVGRLRSIEQSICY